MEGICFFFLGPEPMIFNSRIIFVILGLVLFGFGIALASITTLPYMISIGIKIFKIKYFYFFSKNSINILFKIIKKILFLLGQTIYPDPSDKDLVSDMYFINYSFRF